MLGRGADGRTDSSPLRSDTPCDQEVRKEAQYLAMGRGQCASPYMTTGKTTALTRQTFVGKVMSLLFNMLSRLTYP